MGLKFGPDGDLYAVNRGTDNILRLDSGNGALIGDLFPSGSGVLSDPFFLAFSVPGFVGPDLKITSVEVGDWSPESFTCRYEVRNVGTGPVKLGPLTLSRRGVAIRAFVSTDRTLDKDDDAVGRTTMPVPESFKLQPGESSRARFSIERTFDAGVTPFLILSVDTANVVSETDEKNNERATEMEPPTGVRFRRGDTNTDGGVNLADATGLLGAIYRGTEFPRCPDAADANDDNKLNLADVTTILGWLFRGRTAPAAPGPFKCGEDPTPGGLGACAYDCE